MLLGLLREGEGVAARVLESLGANPNNIRTQAILLPLPSSLAVSSCIMKAIILLPAQVIRMVGESTEAVGAGVGGGSSGQKMPTLEEYGTNLTKLAEEVSFHFSLLDRKSTRLNSSHITRSRRPSSA